MIWASDALLRAHRVRRSICFQSLAPHGHSRIVAGEATGGPVPGVAADEGGVAPVIGVEQTAAVASLEYVSTEGALTG